MRDQDTQIGFWTWVVDDGELSIDRISVQDSHRWQWLAWIIEKQMEEIARDIGASKATTFIDPDNQASQRVHQKGWYQIKTESWSQWRLERSKKL